MAAVNSSVERLRELIPKLREADRYLTTAIEKIEDQFEVIFPEGSYGRILVERPAVGGDWVHIVYEEGLLWVETWSQKRGFHKEDLTKWDVREHKIQAVLRLPDLWEAVSGDQRRV